MRKLFAIGLLFMGGMSIALGDATAAYYWEFEGGGNTAVLTEPGDAAVINVYIEIDSLFAGWHYDLNAEYEPPSIPNFEMTDLWVMPEADRYDGLVTPDIDDYRSFADIREQDPDVYWLDPGTYLIEKLTITATELTADATICFDPTPIAGYNVLYMDPDDGIRLVENVSIPGCLTVVPEPMTLPLLAVGAVALLRRRR